MGFATELLRTHHAGPAELMERVERAERELDMFWNATLLVVPETSSGPPLFDRGASLFFVGAAEHLAREYDLGDFAFRALAEGILRRNGLDATQSMSFLAELRHELLLPDNREALREGGRTIRDWLVGDSNAPLRYTEVARQWRSAHAPNAGT